jgi:N-acetylneuraminic acid mutarotase
MPENWTPRPSLNVARAGLASATARGRIYAIGGFSAGFEASLDSVEARHPGTEEWELVAPMLTPRGNLGAAAVGDRIYAFGGADTDNTPTDLAEVFDSAADQWEQIRQLPVPTSASGTAAFGGNIYVMGGDTAGGTVGSVHVYNPQANTYNDAAPMPTPRAFVRVTELSGRLYAIGGVDEDVEFVAKVERFNPATGIWEKLAPMNTRRGGPGVVTTHRRIFVVGGATGEFGPHHEPLTSSEVFDGHAWHPLDALLPVGRSSLCAERAPGNRILAIGGFEPADPGSTVPSTRVEGLRGGQQ